MDQAIEFSFENDLTMRIELDGPTSVPQLGERVELKDTDGRMISGRVKRRTFRYDGSKCTVSLFLSYN
jgi:hypothetical protein